MFAIIREGNKQYRVAPGDTVRLERFEAESGSEYETDQVLAVNDDKDFKIGHPLVEGARVKGKVVDQVKGEKLVIFKRKRRKHSRRKIGYRQQHTLVQINQISSW